MLRTVAQRKRDEATEFRRVAQMVTLMKDREWCLAQAASLEKEAEALDAEDASITSAPDRG